MSDAAIPFVLAGTVESWNPDTRVLHVAGARLDIPPGVRVDALVPGNSVTVSGHEARDGRGPWIVTKVQLNLS
jgi:hypothetical protein